MRVAVLGAGSWGTTFAKVLADSGADVSLWARRPELAVHIAEQHENPDYLPGIALPPLRVSADAATVLAGADLVAFAVPSQKLRENLITWVPLLPPDAVLISLMKGIELGTAKRMSEVIAEVTGAPPERIAVVSGPNLVREIAQQQPTATVIACTDEATARRVAGSVLGAVPAPVHEHRRDRHRAGRDGQERDRARMRNRHRHGFRGQLHRVVDHPWPGRDGTARCGARRRSDHVRRPGRPRRPGRHVQLPALAQPHLRRAARSR